MIEGSERGVGKEEEEAATAPPGSLREEVLSASGQRRPLAAPAMGQRIVGGAFWTLAQAVGAKILTVGAQLVLAAFLSRRDFGQFAQVTLVVSLLQIGGQMGIGEILVRRHERFRFWADHAFSIEVVTGVGSALLVVMIAPLIHLVVADSAGLPALLLVAATSMPFEAVMAVPLAKLRIDLRFRTISMLGLALTVVIVTCNLTFALLGWGAMSLVATRPIMWVIGSTSAFILSGYRPRFQVHGRRWWQLLRDSRYFVPTMFGTTLLMQGDYMLTSVYFRTEQLGSYFFGFNLSTQTTQMLVSNLNSVLLPTFAKMNREAERQKQAYLKACHMIVLFAAILCIGQAIMVGPLLHLAFGHKWDEAIPLTQILLCGMIFSIPTAIAMNLMQAQGRYYRAMVVNLGAAAIFLVFVAGGTFTGRIVNVAMADALFFLGFGPLTLTAPLGFTLRNLKLVILNVYGWSIPAVAAAGGAALGVLHVLAQQNELVAAMAAATAACLVYLGMLAIFARDDLGELFGRGRHLVVGAIGRRLGKGGDGSSAAAETAEQHRDGGDSD